MVNSDDFVKRLELILDYHGLSASGFADKIGVQRSSLSHLLSGRNKPSLDFVMKIVEVFPEVDLYWLLNGLGEYPKNSKETLSIENNQSKKMFTENPPIIFKETVEKKNSQNLDLFSSEYNIEKNRVFENSEIKNSNTQNLERLKNDAEIDRIVVFYKNGTFKNYIPE